MGQNCTQPHTHWLKKVTNGVCCLTRTCEHRQTCHGAGLGECVKGAHVRGSLCCFCDFPYYHFTGLAKGFVSFPPLRRLLVVHSCL